MMKYKKTYQIRSYEVNKDKKLRLLSLFNILQDTADIHAESLSFGHNFCLQNQLAWVGVSYHIQINERPTWQDEINITTWPSGKTAATAYRDFDVTNKKGDILFKASSQWALIDAQSLRPVALSKHLNADDWLDERAIDTKFPSVNLIERTDFEKTFYVRFDDIDVNNHVNNAVYPVWASEAVPTDFRENHTLKEVRVSFKRPAKMGDVIIIQTQIDENKTTHLIANADKSIVYALVEMAWV